MYRYLVSALLGVSSLGIFSAAAAPAPSTAAWWARATEAFGASSAYVASGTVIRVEELDASGRVASYERGETRLDWSGGESRVVVVRAEKDGKDVSDEWRKRYAKAARPSGKQGASQPEGPPPGFDAAPFDPKYAKALTRGEPRSGASGGFEVPYSIAAEGVVVEGVAAFSGTGEALGAAQAWTKLPAFVSSMRSSVRYAYHEGALVVQSLEIEGEASILFIKKRFRMSFAFSDYRKAPR